MRQKTARCLIALTALAVAGLPAAGEETTAAGDPFAGAERMQLDALVRAVLDRNPSLDAARHAWRAAIERVPQAESWADPMLAVGVAPLSVDSDMPFGASVEARQHLPYPGRLRLAGEAARAAAATAEREIDVLGFELAHLAADLYHQLYLVERSQVVNAEHVRLLGELKETATGRYAAGLAPQQAPLMAEVALTHVLHRDMDLLTDRHVLATRINALLHRPPGAPLPPAAPPPLRAVVPARPPATGHHGPVTVEVPDPAPLPARPELAAAEAEIAALRLGVEVAELERYPDLELMTSYSTMFGGDHRWMVGVGVGLPVRRERRRAAEAEAESRLAAAQSRRQALADEIAAEVEAAELHLAHTAHVLELYRDRLGPASRDQMRAARSGFETGQVDLGTVIEAERNLRDVDLATVEAEVELARAQTDLDRALGRLPGGVTAASGTESTLPRNITQDVATAAAGEPR